MCKCLTRLVLLTFGGTTYGSIHYGFAMSGLVLCIVLSWKTNHFFQLKEGAVVPGRSRVQYLMITQPILSLTRLDSISKSLKLVEEERAVYKANSL